ncbi:MAG: CpsD/CapB family tyrosine-protein kinase [Lachnospiraceae bacterium]
MTNINIEGIQAKTYFAKEAYKTLRTNILWSTDKEIICFTSCTENEGKSSVSFNLALSLAEQEKKVLYIDADIRKSVLLKRIRPDRNAVGLSEYLAGKKDETDIIQTTNVKYLDIIFSGKFPPNPSELLGNGRMKRLLKECRENYDYILIDTSPVGNIADSAIVAGYCDGVIMVVEAGKNNSDIVRRAVEQLEQVNCSIMGFVLNKIGIKTDKYYGKYYGYYYDSKAKRR